MIREIRMITGKHEDRIVEPWLMTGFLEELANGHVGVANTFVDDDALFWILVLVLLRDGVWVMATSCENSCHKGFFHLRHLRGVVLQERLVPDSPHTIKVFISTKTGICIVVFTSVVILKTSSP